MQIEMKVKGLIMDPVTSNPIVVLQEQDGERVLSIWVGVAEANAIAMQMENVTTPRPMTHDLLRDIIGHLDAAVERIVVSDLKETTYYAVIHLRVHDHLVAVDSRPSDAIALALRTRAPIFVEDMVLDTARSAEASRERPTKDQWQRFLESVDPEELGRYKM